MYFFNSIATNVPISAPTIHQSVWTLAATLAQATSAAKITKKIPTLLS